METPTEVIPAVVISPEPVSSTFERLMQRLPLSGGVVAAVLGVGLAQAIGGALAVGSAESFRLQQLVVDVSSYLGSSPLGCDVYDASAGDAPVTMTAPYCTQQVLAERMCNVIIDDDPQVGYATPYSWTTWEGSTAGVEFYNYATTGEKTFQGGNYRTGQSASVRIAAGEWSDLISVGDQTPSRIASAIAPQTLVPTYG